MPEGDTVWLAARRLHAALAGHELVHSDFRVPALATVDLSGRRVHDVASRGKHFLLRVEGGLTVHSHLRMDGSWHLYRRGDRQAGQPGQPGRPVQPGQPGQTRTPRSGRSRRRAGSRRGGPDWQVRAVLATAEWEAVGYRLPVLELLDTADEDRVVGHLGPDLLGADWNLDEAVRRVAAAPDRGVAAALLDQRNLAGVGNLYATELCFITRVSPSTPVGDVADVRGMVALAHRLLVRNRDAPEQITTGDPRRGHEHWVYARAGRPCRRCGTSIQRGEQGDRVTFWCPACQPGPPPRPSTPSRPVSSRTGT